MVEIKKDLLSFEDVFLLQGVLMLYPFQRIMKNLESYLPAFLFSYLFIERSKRNNHIDGKS